MSQSATLSPFLLAAGENARANLNHIASIYRDAKFRGDAAFLQENRPSLSLKRKRASADLPKPSSSLK